MKNYLRIVVSLLVIVFVGAASGQTPKKEAYWGPLKVVVTQKQPGWLDRLENELDEFPEFSSDLLKLRSDKAVTPQWKKAYRSTLDRIESYVIAETAIPDPSATKVASQILAGAEYKSVRDAPGKNWLEKILERIKNLKFDQPNKPNIPFPELGWLAPLLRGLLYVLGAVAAGILIWLLTKLRMGAIQRKQRARGGGILDDGEELLSEDEYILSADTLVAQGRFREACRALYLAMLVRLDSSRIARLEPAETNWEHLRRVEANKTKPEGLDFRTPTKLFDHAWYGYSAKSAEDVEPFRASYLAIRQLTAPKSEAA